MQFSWVDAVSQPTFATAFGVSASAAPTLVLLSPRKLRFARLAGRFEQATVQALIERLLTGQVATTPLTSLPSLEEGGEAPPAEVLEEEEFDLSDIMGEAVAESADDRAALLAQARIAATCSAGACHV